MPQKKPLFAGGYSCQVCGKSFKHGKSYRRHRKVHLGFIYRCDKCSFKSVREDTLRRHKGLIHLRRRTTYVPRRSISTKNKRKALQFWNSSSASSPEKRSLIQSKFKLSPNTQSRLFRKKDTFPAARKRLFRVEGAGRHVDKTFVQIETRVMRKFKASRKKGCFVHRRHMVNFFYASCAELGINLIEEAEKREWKFPAIVIRKRIDRLCKREKIVMKTASRQLHKGSKVRIHIILSQRKEKSY